MFSGSLGELATRTYAHQMMDGLHAMHKKGYTHRNLRPNNILLSQNFVLKIADFGHYHACKEFCSYQSPFDTDTNQDISVQIPRHERPYQAPEVVQRKPNTYKADLFSVSVILFTLYCGFVPFQEAVDTDWWWKRLSKGVKYLEKSKKYLPNDPAKSNQYKVAGIKSLTSFWNNHTKRIPIDQEFQALMINMLHPSPDRRFNHQQIRNHKWHNEKILTQKETEHFMIDRIKKIHKNRKKKVSQIVYDRIQKIRNEFEKDNFMINYNYFKQDESSVIDVMNQVT